MIEIAFSLLLGIGVLIVVLAVHEIGHLAAGHLCGFRLGWLTLGPVGLIRTAEGWHSRWLPPALWGPSAMAYPDSSARLTSRISWYVAGGPLASALGAAFAAVAAQTMPEGLLQRLVALLSLLSLGICVATLQPFGTGTGIPSDGARLWTLLLDRQAGRSAAALTALEGPALAGVRPRDWEPDLVQQASQVATPPAYALAATTLWLKRALDVGDPAAARDHLARVQREYARTPRWLRGDAAAEAAIWWYATVEQDEPTARRHLADVRGPLVPAFRRLTAEAAVAKLAGYPVRARMALDRAAAVTRQHAGVASAWDLERIEAIGVELPTDH